MEEKKLIECPHCKSEIPHGANVCRGCQAEISYGPSGFSYAITLIVPIVCGYFLAKKVDAELLKWVLFFVAAVPLWWLLGKYLLVRKADRINFERKMNK
ncbi:MULTISPECIES: hypothetical protein [Enterobacterales]|uniref:hypothetical protein n=1 Tax=Enterobacteriaceae TaxID=543 RepID=UPI00195B1D2C|nr:MULTISPECIES: hypothetical protein [Enterobacteriaceae]MDV0481136.1 hypothetical protein [Enterobacter roggenkampii]MDV0481147.1 hypothetical protein [Enterobacter roggenkampii]QRQ77082.1 hypothetical protein JQN59_26785 [Citrobacter sp. B72]